MRYTKGVNMKRGLLPFYLSHRNKMIPAKKRFEVLKRDGFRCQYCWKCGKDVTLEVDHVIPQADWWTDDFNNLITACRECNMGKWKTELNERNSKFNVKVKDLYESIKRYFYKDRNLWIETANEEFGKNYDWTIEVKTMSLFATFLQRWIDEHIKNPKNVKKRIEETIEIMRKHEETKNDFWEIYLRENPITATIKDNPSLMAEKIQEFYEWGDFFDEIKNWYLWDFLCKDCYIERSIIEEDTWNTDDMDKRLNYEITCNINELWGVPKRITKKYSYLPNAKREC